MASTLDGRPPVASPGPRATRAGRRLWLAIGAVAVIALSALVAFGVSEAFASSSVGMYSGHERPAATAPADPSGIELGAQFSVSVPGSIVALRYYRTSDDATAHTGTLWNVTGAALANVTFDSRTKSGWQKAKLAKPVAIAPGETYVVSYHTQGPYAEQEGAFDVGRKAASALVFGAAGVYRDGTAGFPDERSPNNAGYYIDVLFQPSDANASGAVAAASVANPTPTKAGQTLATGQPSGSTPIASVTAAALPHRAASPGATPKASPADAAASFAAIYRKWSDGPDPSGSPYYFPIGVFYQDFDRPSGVAPVQDSVFAYLDAGINLQVGGYDCDNDGCPNGDRDPDLAGAVADNSPAHPVECACDVMGTEGSSGVMAPFQSLSLAKAQPTTVGLVIKANFIIGYDEADMNEVDFDIGSEYAAPAVSASYAAIKAADPTRPVVAGFGKCFSIPDWNGCQAAKYSGQGLSTTAALKMYCANADIISSDFYANDREIGDGPGHDYEYGLTVDNTRSICGSSKIVGFDVNTGDLGGGDVSPSDIQAATWDGIMHGANFVNYFVDDITASGGQAAENGLLQPGHQAALAQVTADDALISALAPWLNAPNQSGVTTTATNGIPITTMLKTYGGHTYLFALADGDSSHPTSGSTSVTLNFPAKLSGASAAVFDESRTVAASNGSIHDTFTPYQLHVYELS